LAGAADLLQVGDPGYAADDGQEHDRADQHLHRGDERRADRLHVGGEIRPPPAQHDADHDRHQHLHVQLPVPRRPRDAHGLLGSLVARGMRHCSLPDRAAPSPIGPRQLAPQ
jgi:hypothetical protein